ncbi:MAG: hypothetical protein ACAH89_15420 [Rariglobus sp.]|nr:hypothetical protein [Rariglobus sp.]
MKPHRLCIVASAFLAFALPGHAQVTWLSQNFDDVSTGSYTAATSTVGSGTGLLNLTGASTGYASVTTVSGANNALTFVDNSSGSVPIAYSSLSGLSTNGTGNNSLTGSFDFRIINTGGTVGTLVFAVNSGTNTSTSGVVSSVQILFAGLNVQVQSAAGVSGTLATLSYATDYRLGLVADYSSTTQDSYSFTITDLGTSGIVYSSGVINTRAANAGFGTILFNGAGNAGGGNANPYFQLDNLNFTAQNISAIPEPATAAVFAAAGALLLAGLRVRNRNRSANS